MMSYFFTNSQCGCAPLCKIGISPSSKTFKFSSGVFPTGTISAGILGNVYNFSKSSAASTSTVSDNFLLFSFNKTVFSFKIAAFDFSPAFINSPISLDNLLDSDKMLSNSTCVARRFSSNCTTSSTTLLASIFLFAKAVITFS